MYAYICYPSHIGLLAASYCEGNNFATPEIARGEACRVAHVLAQQIIDSVASRYPDSKDGQRPGPTFIAGKGNDQAIIDLSVAWAAHYSSRKVAAAPIELIKLAHTLDYQSCETTNYQNCYAAIYIRQIIYTQTRKLKGYLEADDNWADQNPPESVRDFFVSIDESEQ
jgi:hypothetical protein